MVAFHPYVREVEGAFTRYAETHVDLGAEWTRLGREMAKSTIELVEARAELADDCPLLLKDQSFIAGSLGRRTQEQPLDDIDVYLVLEAPTVLGTTDGTPHPLVSQFSRPRTPLTEDPTLRCGVHFSADAVLDRFAQYLALWFLGKPTGKGRAGKTCFVQFGPINIDLCPVILFKSTVGGIDEYWMPAGGGSPHWKRTNPKQDQAFLSDANQAHDGELLRLIRMMKWWNAKYNADRLKGIHLETMATNALEGVTIAGWANPLARLFDGLHDAIDAPCPDPTRLGDPLESSLSWSDRLSSKNALLNSKAVAKLAADAAAPGKAVESIGWWQSIFPELGR